MKNKLTDLNNHLFAQLERLGEESLTGDKLLEEIGRAKAVTNVAQQIVNNGNLALNAIKVKEEFFPDSKALPEIFEGAIPIPQDSRGSANSRKIPEKLKIDYERD
ncbi:MAG: hypothetical protein NC238_02915 [Dehalobacter sp.]|nr:hypothetical protein [Dehalobacter sp.]